MVRAALALAACLGCNQGSVLVYGWLYHADGSPAADAEVSLVPTGQYLSGEAEHAVRADGDGRYVLEHVTNETESAFTIRARDRDGAHVWINFTGADEIALPDAWFWSPVVVAARTGDDLIVSWQSVPAEPAQVWVGLYSNLDEQRLLWAEVAVGTRAAIRGEVLADVGGTIAVRDGPERFEPKPAAPQVFHMAPTISFAPGTLIPASRGEGCDVVSPPRNTFECYATDSDYVGVLDVVVPELYFDNPAVSLRTIVAYRLQAPSAVAVDGSLDGTTFEPLTQLPVTPGVPMYVIVDVPATQAAVLRLRSAWFRIAELAIY